MFDKVNKSKKRVAALEVQTQKRQQALGIYTVLDGKIIQNFTPQNLGSNNSKC